MFYTAVSRKRRKANVLDKREENFMKKVSLKWMAFLTVLIALGFVFVSCDEDPGIPPDPLAELFVNHGRYSIRVTNNSNEDLIAFKSNLTQLIGGVPRASSNHGFKEDPALFPATPAHFELIFIRRSDYENNKNNLTSLNSPTFTSTYVFWNGAAGDNEKVYEISNRLGGMHGIRIWNSSSYNVEVRENGIAGPTIGYSPAGMTTTVLNVAAGSYLLYPVFQAYNSRRGIMETIIPVASNSVPYFEELGFSPLLTTRQVQVMNLHKAVTSTASRKSGVVSVLINNGSGTGIRFNRGNIEMIPAGGTEVISSGAGAAEFNIFVPSSNNTYANSIQASNWTVTSGGYPAEIKELHTGNTSFDLLTDNMYIINVQGSVHESDFRATIETRASESNGPTVFQAETVFNNTGTAPPVTP